LRLRELDQRFDANQTSLVILEADDRLFVRRHERVDTLTEEHYVFAILDDFAQ